MVSVFRTFFYLLSHKLDCLPQNLREIYLLTSKLNCGRKGLVYLDSKSNFALKNISCGTEI